MDRQPGDLAGQVPQRNIHGADRPRRRHAVAPLQLLVHPLTVERILADDGGLEVPHHRQPVELGAAAGVPEEGVPFDPLVRRNRDEAEVTAPFEPRREAPVLRRGDVVPREELEGEVGDLHSLGS